MSEEYNTTSILEAAILINEGFLFKEVTVSSERVEFKFVNIVFPNEVKFDLKKINLKTTKSIISEIYNLLDLIQKINENFPLTNIE